MRVLHLLEATLGGTRAYLDNFIAASRDLPFESTLVHANVRSDSGFEGTLKRARDAGWQVVEVPMVRRLDPIADLRAVRQVAQILNDRRPDVLHCHSSKAGGVGRLGAMLSRSRSRSRSRPLVVYSPHALAANVARRYLLMERALVRLTDRFAAVSDSEKAEIIGFGLADEQGIDVIPPVIDAAQYAPVPQDDARCFLGLDPGPLLIGIGRLTEQKDPSGFVHVVDLLRRRGSEVHALWIGDGDLRDTVEREIRERDLSTRLQVLGWVDDVKPYICAADLLLSTARFESFGYCVAEALCLERPAVASRVTGTVDVIRDGATPLLYPTGDYEAAAALVDRMLRDRDEAKRLARLGRDSVRREFSLRRMSRRIADAYSHAPGAEIALRNCVTGLSTGAQGQLRLRPQHSKTSTMQRAV